MEDLREKAKESGGKKEIRDEVYSGAVFWVKPFIYRGEPCKVYANDKEYGATTRKTGQITFQLKNHTTYRNNYLIMKNSKVTS